MKLARQAARALPWVLGVVALAGSCTKEAAVPAHARFIDGDIDANGDVTEMVKAQKAKSVALGRRLLIYVGATWCEPCQRFHEAAAQGQLDDMLAKVDLLTFDLDKDRGRLTAAGCDSNMIPLLSLPDDFGRCTDHRIEGSIKGTGAVAQMTPRLQELLASPR